MDREAALTCARRYAAEVTKELSPERIVMFGSHSSGQAGADSDIDIAVIFDGFAGDFLKTSAWLWSLTWGISSHIEPVLLDKTSDKSGFVAEIIKTGEVIYRQ